MHRLLVAIAVGSCCAPAAAQVRPFFTAPMAELPSVHATSLAPTPDGALWIGTGAGLARYDGADVGIAAGTERHAVRHLGVDDAGALWVAHARGLGVVQDGVYAEVDLGGPTEMGRLFFGKGYAFALSRGGSWWSLEVAGGRPSAHVRPAPDVEAWVGHSAVVAGNGVQLLGTQDHGLWAVGAEASPVPGLTGGKAGPMVVDASGRVYIATDRGLYRYVDGAVESWADRGVPADTYISGLALGRGGRLFVGTSEGALLQIDDPGGLGSAREVGRGPPQSVFNLFAAPSGALWGCTWGGGAIRYDPALEALEVLDGSRGLPGGVVQAFASDAEGGVWVATNAGAHRLRSAAWLHLGAGALGGPVLALERVASGEVVAGTAAGLALLDGVGVRGTLGREDGLIHSGVETMAPFGGGLLAAGPEHGGGVTRLTAELAPVRFPGAFAAPDPKRGQVVLALHGGRTALHHYRRCALAVVDPDGSASPLDLSGLGPSCAIDVTAPDGDRTWLATRRGLGVLSDGRAALVDVELRDPELRSVAVDASGAVWVAYARPLGVTRISGARSTPAVEHLDTRSGLPSDDVGFLGAAADGGMWIGARGAVAVWRDGALERVYRSSDGLAVTDPVAWLEDAAGVVWIGGVNGLDRFDPAQAAPPPTEPPVVGFTRAELGGATFADGASVPFDQRALEAHFAAISLADEGHTRYRVRLRPWTDWGAWEELRRVRFPRLDAGTYTLEVQARTVDGRTSPPAALTFAVRPPWWRTPGFALLCVLGGVLVVLAGVRLRTASLRRGQRALEEQVARRTAQLVDERSAAEEARAQVDEQRRRAEVAVRELREVDRLRAEMVQNVSHELRTPLTLLLAPTESLLAADPAPDARAQLEVIRSNALRLLHQVNSFLDIQKADAGELGLRLEPCDPATLVARVVHLSSARAEARGLSLTHALAPVELRMLDRDRISTALLNLIANALKFTPPGGAIHVVLERVGDARVRFSVQDTGPGVPEGQRDAVFERFRQLDGSLRRAQGGTGIGLALVRIAAELHGGRAWVDPAEGGGAAFRLEIDAPVASDGPDDSEWERASTVVGTALEALGSAAVTDPAAPERAVDPNAPLVLVADDERDMQGLLARILQDEGYRVRRAADGEDARVQLSRQSFDLLVTDLMMPRMSGLDLIGWLRAHEPTRGLPVVLLTAKTERETRLRVVQGGADAFLAKPFSAAELTALVRNLLALKHSEREVRRLNAYLVEQVLGRFLPPSLVERAKGGELELDFSPEERRVTVLFADLVGFTSLSERTDPRALAAMLNRFLAETTAALFAHEGIVDKFIGDAIMGLFGVPEVMASAAQARCAVLAARRMHDRVAALSEELGPEFPLQLRVGIHQGVALVGNFGSELHIDYTAVGPTVNACARLQAQAEPGETWVSGAVAEHLDGPLRALGPVELRGVPEPLEAFAVDE